MLAYYISQSNSYTFRCEPTASTLNQFTMSLEDMTTLDNFTASLTDVEYTTYESFLAFTASISGAQVGSEYRAVIYNGTPSGSVDIWRGSIQVYSSQSIDKSVYENQIPLGNEEVSHVSENKYIIMN